MQQSTVSVRGQTVIPHEIREELGIAPRTKLAWSVRNGVITVIPIPQDPIEASFGILAGRGYTLDDFLRERQEERERERQLDARDDERIRKAIGKRRRTR
jgi:AbrB family looped-hinge helix DNA binding protein